MESKNCNACNQEKSLDSFSPKKTGRLGRMAVCKPCRAKRMSVLRTDDEYRLAELARNKAWQERSGYDILGYAKEDRKKNAAELSRKKQERNEKYPLMLAARSAVRNAVRRGDMTRQSTCSVCGSESRIEAHHDDYLKPLSVRWLCRGCHSHWHSANGSGKNQAGAL